MGQLQEIHSQLTELGFQILFVSPDRPEKIRAAKEKSKFDYVLLSDSKMTAAEAFGVAFKVDDGTLEQYKKYGIDLEEASGETHHVLPVPAVFVIDTEGTIQFQYVDPDYRVRIAPDLLLAAARASLK